MLGNVLSKGWAAIYKLSEDFVWQRENKIWMINQEDVYFREILPLDQVFFVLVSFLWH